MATKHLTSKARPGRNRTQETAATAPAGSPSTGELNSPPWPLLLDRLQEAIEAERSQLLQAHSLLTCLREVLLYADDEHALHCADSVSVAAKLIDESVERLDWVNLQAVIDGKRGESESEYPDLTKSHPRDDDVVKDSAHAGYYLC